MIVVYYAAEHFAPDVITYNPVTLVRSTRDQVLVFTGEDAEVKIENSLAHILTGSVTRRAIWYQDRET
jgi:hypothetical protein